MCLIKDTDNMVELLPVLQTNFFQIYKETVNAVLDFQQKYPEINVSLIINKAICVALEQAEQHHVKGGGELCQ